MSLYVEILDKKYPNKAILTREEVCDLLRISPASFNRYVNANELNKMPTFKRFGGSKNARYLFPRQNVIDFLEGMK